MNPKKLNLRNYVQVGYIITSVIRPNVILRLGIEEVTQIIRVVTIGLPIVIEIVTWHVGPPYWYKLLQ